MKHVNEVPAVEKHNLFSGRAKPLEIPHGRWCRHLPVVLSLKEKRWRCKVGDIAFDSNLLLLVEQSPPRELEPVSETKSFPEWIAGGNQRREENKHGVIADVLGFAPLAHDIHPADVGQPKRRDGRE